MLDLSNLVILLLLGFQDLPVQVQRLQSASPENGIWQGIDAEGLKVGLEGQDRSLPLNSLKNLRFGNKPSISDSGIVVTLRDGSLLEPIDVLSDGKGIRMVFTAEDSVVLPANCVRTIQFQKLTELQQTQWRAIQESRIAGDTLVVIRSAEALDKVEGAIKEIAAEKVAFEFSQQKIDAPRAKLAGLKLFSPAVQNRRVTAVIKDVWGNSWQAHQLTSRSLASLNIELACGAGLELLTTQLMDIDFSIGSTQYVADLTPISSERLGGLTFRVPLAGSEQLFGAHAVRLPQTGGSSLRMMGSGSVTYRIPEEYQTLTGKVYLAPDGQQFTSCAVQIKLENQTIWEGKLADLAERLEFTVKIHPDQRLQLYVQAESKFPVGDVVVWQELRMLK